MHEILCPHFNEWLPLLVRTGQDVSEDIGITQEGRLSRLDQEGFEERRRDKRGPPSRLIEDGRRLRAPHKGAYHAIAIGIRNGASIRRLHGLKPYDTAGGLAEIPDIRQKVLLKARHFLPGD
jgi:hypothetical protein